MIERFGHGGDIWTAAELYGLDKNGFTDFSSNMNPLGPPAIAGRIIREEWQRELSRYPDPDCRELRARIAGEYDIPMESILAGNGAAELIDLAVRALAPHAVGLLRPCFAEYAKAAQRTGAAVIDIPLSPGNGFVPDSSSAELWNAAGQADVLFLGHPNNPTGQLLPELFLERILAGTQSVILDEAFIDFAREERRCSRIRQAACSEKLFVVRSMTKFYTVPGLRLGFIVAHPGWIRRMKALQVEWSVNGLAQRIGEAVIGDRQYEAATREWLGMERPRLKSELEGLGFHVTDSETNYLLFRMPLGLNRTVQELQQYMGRKGLLIRDASAFPGLGPQYGRTAVRLAEDNRRLIAGLAASLEEMRRES
ncbi:MAG: cobalamin biosynthesis protein CobQ [Paenibacillaceae bacterium]|nr:cobalamin biosynthesis protein CobQ [Paenibacillaceae bacterium]